ncbi:NlpC/P60 family protein [Parasphingorhabdus pacifica]
MTATVAPGGVAVPPRPPNPSDREIEAGRLESQTAAARVGELTNRLAQAESKLAGLTTEVELAMEDANRARVDLQRAERDARAARGTAERAAAEVEDAGKRVERQRKRLDGFAAGSYRQGSSVGSATAYVGSNHPEELLDRAEMLDVLSVSQQKLLDELQRARVQRANRDSRARDAAEEAEAKRATAARARRAAEQARTAAIEAQRTQRQRARGFEAERAQVEAELVAAREQVDGLEGQREEFQRWLNAKREEEQAAAQLAAEQAEQAEAATETSTSQEVASGSSVEVVVQRALAQTGTIYAWGGGNAHGPTQGIRDGGVADAHGDYLKTGFDCSGLMLYAFAGVGVSLDHYSGYQYQSGTRVPVSQRRRGDMLFWRSGGSIHHVALYLGNGRMVEAPYSGARVRVTSVRYGGLAPYAVRMF